MSKLTNMKSRSKSQRKQSRELQTLSAQLSSFFPQTTTASSQRNKTLFLANQKAIPAQNAKPPVSKDNSRTALTSISSSSAFNRLYQNAEQTRKKKDKLRELIDEERGLSFSPKLFKSPHASASGTTVIERNEQFEKNKWQKRREREELKYSECSFEPTLISRSRC